MQKKTVVFATSNPNKVKEISNMLADTEIAVTLPTEGFDPEETGTTFEENAYIKASEAAKLTGQIAIGDDSGLVIDELNGMPGIYSSRYAENDAMRIARIQQELEDVNAIHRSARFVCAMVAVDENGKILKKCIGTCEGKITKENKGSNGFGYDPVFLIPELEKTMAELTMEEKNSISHRSKALKCMIEWLKGV